jgi:HEPN domain-containing protein
VNKQAASFIALAKEDIAAARKLLDALPGPAAFHLQQAAEKLLKAVLSVEGIHFNAAGGHQLGQMAELLPGDHIWRPDLMAFDRYTTYATSTRYPLPGGAMPRVPSKADIEKGLKEVESLVGEITDWCEEEDRKKAR